MTSIAAPHIGMTVMATCPEGIDFVKAGQPRVQLDSVDAKLALEQMSACLRMTCAAPTEA